ncbi:MAG: response regulator [Proteobacteria bacterium]|nr:response regulator [Pseudomonadota bacterium]
MRKVNPGQMTVLVVDQNQPVHVLVRSVLRDLGFRSVVSALDCSEALETFQRQKIDLVITHCGHAAFDGIELVKKIRAPGTSSNPYVPILMVSSQANKGRVMAARDAGVHEFIAKPFTAGDLARHVTEVLDRPRPFVRAATYFGPDRRRRSVTFKGPERRQAAAEAIAVDAAGQPLGAAGAPSAAPAAAPAGPAGADEAGGSPGARGGPSSSSQD